jgi:hypothetical protein
VRRAARAQALALLAGAGLLGGCVYYNGMYNTTRLAKAARKAERDGRAYEAKNLWGQVITRADSLVVRHPDSKYADQATVIRGIALARLDQCPAAVAPLARFESVPGLDQAIVEEAALSLGRCRLELGDPALAVAALSRVIDSKDPARRHEARFRHARALRLTGRYPEAVAELRETADPRGRTDLLLALAGTGRTAEALGVADTLLSSRDTSVVWDSVVAALGRQDPRAATGLVDRLAADTSLTPEDRARRLYQDGLRLEAVDSGAAVARLRQAVKVTGHAESADRARVYLLRLDLTRVESLDQLGPLSDSLTAVARRESGVAAEAAALGLTVARLRLLADSAGPSTDRGDLRLFLGAETARDTLHAPLLAAGLFRRLAEEWSASPYAPKALLAAQLLDPTDADGTEARLDSLYPDSPYLAAIRGEDAPGYRALEDSLQAYATAQAAPAVRVAPGAPRRGVDKDEPRRRPGVRLPNDEDTPSGRRRPQL